MSTNPNSQPLQMLLTPEHIVDARWREVILNTARLIKPFDQFQNYFLDAINGLIARDKTLVKLIWWVWDYHGETRRFGAGALRAAYCYLATLPSIDLYAHNRKYAAELDDRHVYDLTRDLFSDPSFNRSHAYDRAISRAGDLDHTDALELAQLIDHQFYTLPPDHEFYIDLAFTYAVMFARFPSKFPNIDTGTRLFWRPKGMYLGDTYLAELIGLSRRLGFTDMQRKLSHLNVPDREARSKAWAKFADELSDIVYEYAHIKDWILSKQQLERLRQYIAANQLLISCAERAMVADKSSFKDSLLLPPG